MDKIREMARGLGADFDLAVIGSTHVHEGPDVIGIWGPNQRVSGVDPAYNDFVNEQGASAIVQAIASLEEAKVTIGQTPTVDASGSLIHYVSDTRDPAILDPNMTVALFTTPAAPSTPIAALVVWTAHPEYTGSRNNDLSSDYPYYLREALEKGFTRMGQTYPALAPNILYMSGPLGGQIGPGLARPLDDQGMEVTASGFAKARACGLSVAPFAHKAIANGAVELDGAGVPISLRSKRLFADVDNNGYHVAFFAGLFADRRELFNWDQTRPIGPDNTPQVRSEVAYVRLGPLSFITAPGELFPELFVGGYDGSSSYDFPIVDPMNKNPPDVSQAPPGPYLRDLMEGDYKAALGLTMDMLGYIIPPFNFELAGEGGFPGSPYLDEAPGDHYEETNSVGPNAEPQLIGVARQLITYGRQP
jgi:hypothetical protein